MSETTNTADELITRDNRMSLEEAAEFEGVNQSTVWRWATQGLKRRSGRKLAIKHFGGAAYTSRLALDRFHQEGDESSMRFTDHQINDLNWFEKNFMDRNSRRSG